MEIRSEISKKISNLAKKGIRFLFLIDFNGNGEVYTVEEAYKEGIIFDFGTDKSIDYNSFYSPPPQSEVSTVKATDQIKGKSSALTVHPIPFSTYLKAFNTVQEALHRGDTYLLNLTFATPVETDYSLFEIFLRSKASYKLLYKDNFVVFSPERFIRIHDGVIETNPMKGTIDANLYNAENKVLNNSKEHFEHNTIVDLLRNDLNMVATDVRVQKFRYVEKIKTHKGALLQVSSLINGKLPENHMDHLGDIIQRLLPAGSVTGAPKERTVELIRKIEDYERGFYTGVFGYFDGQMLDVAVAIRFIENVNGQLFYKSGGGITSLSNAEDEYNELQAKIYVPIF